MDVLVCQEASGFGGRALDGRPLAFDFHFLAAGLARARVAVGEVQLGVAVEDGADAPAEVKFVVSVWRGDGRGDVERDRLFGFKGVDPGGCFPDLVDEATGDTGFLGVDDCAFETEFFKPVLVLLEVEFEAALVEVHVRCDALEHPCEGGDRYVWHTS